VSQSTDWSSRLRRIAEPVLAGTPLIAPATMAEKQRYIETFADEAGTRRYWDPLLLGHMLGVAVDPSPEPWLWSWNALASTAPGGGEGRMSPPFFAGAESWALEQETEKELAGLHAWSWLQRRGPRADARGSGAAFDAAVEWTIANIQPDNATNHPWAIQVFLDRAATGAARTHSDARLYAETMLHNCLVTTGRPDLVSALILWDAAAWLESKDFRIRRVPHT